MKRVIFAFTVLSSGVTGALADDSHPHNKTDSDVGFVQPGKDYVIRFAGDSNPFTLTQTDTSSVKKKDGYTVGPWTVNYAVAVFTIVENAGGSWVLVEHPKKMTDAFHWNAKRPALSALNDTTIRELEASVEGQQKLRELREQAAAEIPTARSWINLQHAVAIAAPPSSPQDAELQTTVTITDSE